MRLPQGPSSCLDALVHAVRRGRNPRAHRLARISLDLNNLLSIGITLVVKRLSSLPSNLVREQGAGVRLPPSVAFSVMVSPIHTPTSTASPSNANTLVGHLLSHLPAPWPSTIRLLPWRSVIDYLLVGFWYRQCFDRWVRNPYELSKLNSSDIFFFLQKSGINTVVKGNIFFKPGWDPG